MTPLAIELVPCLSDNYAYLVRDEDAGLTAVVDPSEAPPVVAALARRGWTLTHILNTHHHFDHTGGNIPLKEKYGAEIVGPGKDRARFAGLDTGVDETTGWRFGGRDMRVMEIPAHTSSHIAFVVDDAAFTGDTLFAMGCGRLFEGTPAVMWSSLSKLMALPYATRIFCGHEYTQSNGRFALTLEPGNAALVARMKEVDAARAKGLPTIPSTMALEKQTNPFLRPGSPELRKTLGMETASDVEVFGETRRRKDDF
ncbi:MAG: hydroxyacylglutathione hydrolase [Alphaproteobacteria bacterium]|nr:hydroxyacylglutathione hydrolase [Alphaproteobacteria bacterium]